MEATDMAVAVSASRAGGLLAALEQLDVLLAQAVAVAQYVYGPGADSDPFRGLHIGPEDVAALLGRAPGTPVLCADALALDTIVASDASGRLAWLAQTFGLTSFDLGVILIALAPEVDLRYERIYAYLQDDVARRRPSIDLVLNLLCHSAVEKIARRSHFSPDAPLIRHDLLHLLLPGQDAAPLLSHQLKVDDQIVDVLLGQVGLDHRLATFCHIVTPTATVSDLPLDQATIQGLGGLAVQATVDQHPLRLYFQGAAGSGRRRAAEALAAALGLRLLVTDLAHMPEAGEAFDSALRLVFRESWFQGAVLYLNGVDALAAQERNRRRQTLDRLLAASEGMTLLAGAQPWVSSPATPAGVVVISFSAPAAVQRRACWQKSLAAEGMTLDDGALDLLAARFRLGPGQIADAVGAAWSYAGLRRACLGEGLDHPCDDMTTLPDLFAAARAQCGHELATLAQRITPTATWDDIVLPDDTLAQLHEICTRAAEREQVLETWGFARKLARGRGTSALFAGSSGTGKTMAAEIIAGELGLDLYTIDLAGVVSKYIGETEKNLDRIFRAAEDANAVLLFDEADALFGKRSEVKDSHDRYANIEISYLLQKIEQYEGLAILATNLRQHLDEAFLRRLAFNVTFPFPDEHDRRRIWAVTWPAATPLASDVDLDFLARQFKLSGGNIKNIALAAAYLAASDDGVVTLAHLRHATRREYQKLGKALSDAELGEN